MKKLIIFLLVVAAMIGFGYWIAQTKFWPFAIFGLLLGIASEIRDAIHEHDGKVYARGARKARRRRED